MVGGRSHATLLSPLTSVFPTIPLTFISERERQREKVKEGERRRHRKIEKRGERRRRERVRERERKRERESV